MRKVLLLLLTLLCLSCFQTERQCSDFKTGEFEFDYEVDGIKKTGRFVRTETLNIDFYENKVDSASIRWINDCEFIQKKINPINQNEEKAIHFKILTTSEDSYTFEYQLAVKDAYKKKRVEKGFARKIK
ncbi:MAG: hypothetical protein ACI9OT_000918 [Gammaproteobacteria bacterium]|jgi:hypothetical protein